MFLGGSLARGEADEYSDIDLCVIVRDDAYDDVFAGRETFVRTLGEPLFLEDFGNEQHGVRDPGRRHRTGVQLLRAGDLDAIRPGPHRVLLEKDGSWQIGRSRRPRPDGPRSSRQLRGILFWFWHDVGHFTTAMGRGQLWWAAGQLEQLRGYCVNLIRIGQGGDAEDEPYWKLDHEIATEALDVLRSTFVSLDGDALLRAGVGGLAFFRERAPGLAEPSGSSTGGAGHGSLADTSRICARQVPGSPDARTNTCQYPQPSSHSSACSTTLKPAWVSHASTRSRSG